MDVCGIQTFSLLEFICEVYLIKVLVNDQKYDNRIRCLPIFFLFCSIPVRLDWQCVGTLTYLMPAKSLFLSLESCRNVCGAETIQEATGCCTEVNFQLGKGVVTHGKFKKSGFGQTIPHEIGTRSWHFFKPQTCQLNHIKWCPQSSWNTNCKTETEIWINACCYRDPSTCL